VNDIGTKKYAITLHSNNNTNKTSSDVVQVVNNTEPNKPKGDGSLAWEIIEKCGDTSADAITPECLPKLGKSLSLNVEQDVNINEKYRWSC